MLCVYDYIKYNLYTSTAEEQQSSSEQREWGGSTREQQCRAVAAAAHSSRALGRCRRCCRRCSSRIRLHALLCHSYKIREIRDKTLIS